MLWGLVGKKKDPKVQAKNEKPIGKIVDFAPIKNFIDYGLNKTLINIKLKRETDIRVRETLSKMKPQTNWTKMGMFFVLFMMGAVMAYILMSQYMNWADAIAVAAQCKADLTICAANLGTQAAPVLAG